VPHPVRDCVLCGQSDDHPRVIRVVGDLTQIAHHDCLAAALDDGENDELKAIVEHSKGKKGDELRAYLLSPEHRKFKAGLEAARDKAIIAASKEG
jgi:hypothetical protein